MLIVKLIIKLIFSNSTQFFFMFGIFHKNKRFVSENDFIYGLRLDLIGELILQFH